MRLPFYEIDPEVYLFPKKTTRPGIRENREEPVRQWCAHELLRAYGIPVGQIEFERQVRVGSKRYRIDVLISKGGKPWAVIECKERNNNKHEGGIEQARSYANTHGINATFIIYTNGDVWRVQRRIGEDWVTVPDLPQWHVPSTEETIVPILRMIDLLKPLLHQIDQDVVGDDALNFLGAMQVLFNGSNLITEDSDKSLVNSLDYLLRSICCPGNHTAYRRGKLCDAYGCFERFRQSTGMDMILPEVMTETDARSEIHALSVGINQLIESEKEVTGESSLLLRLASSLLHCGWRFEGRKTRDIRIPSEVHGALREYLNHVLVLRLNVSLPDAIDAITCGDMRDYCKPSKRFGWW
ncbi:MAG: type I restriction enzyme HsdR N-terminal domain-containing protein [Chthoniobacterales bacterium]